MPAQRADAAAEILVDEGPPHVDVAEEDAVHGVVEQHVEPLVGRAEGDLRHAQAGRVVGQLDVALQPPALLVQRLAHDAEVLLRGVGAAVALGGGAVGHVVEQRLRRAADDGDDVGAGLGRRPGLVDVVVDVAGRDDDVLVRRSRHGELRAKRVALGNASPQLLGGGPGLAAHLSPEVLLHLGRQRLKSLHWERGKAFHRIQRTARPQLQRPPVPVGGPPVQHPGRLEAVGHEVGQRNAARAGIRHAKQPQHGALHGNGGVAPDELEDWLNDVLSHLPRPGNLGVLDEGTWHGWGLAATTARGGHASPGRMQRVRSPPKTIARRSVRRTARAARRRCAVAPGSAGRGRARSRFPSPASRPCPPPRRPAPRQ